MSPHGSASPTPALHTPRRRPRSRPRLRHLTVAGLCLTALAGCAAAHGVPATSGQRAGQGYVEQAQRWTPTGPARATDEPTPTPSPSPSPSPGADAATNPLAGHRMGVYKGLADQAWEPYTKAKGEERRLLGKIALTPKAKWFGSWIPDNEIAKKVADYISNSQAGDPDALVQMTFFRMVPWEHAACDRLPTAAEQKSYKQWTNRAASAIGDAHVAIILQPDGPFSLCAPGGSTLPASLISYAARVLSAKPHTSVYLDAGAADWPHVSKGGVDSAVKFLLPAGVRHVRGIALNSTHYSATPLEVDRGAAIVQELARRGLPGKKVVINTSSSGNPFEFGRYTGKDPDNAFVCRSVTDDRTCVRLGLPPTTDVGAARWGLPAATRTKAEKYVDAYLWFGRPWLYRQADPFVKSRGLQLARTWAWDYPQG